MSPMSMKPNMTGLNQTGLGAPGPASSRSSRRLGAGRAGRAMVGESNNATPPWPGGPGRYHRRTMARILVLDNYDSFVYTLDGYLQQLGAETEVLRNDAFP